MTHDNIQRAIDAGIDLAQPTSIGGSTRFFTQVTTEGSSVRVLDLEELAAPLAEHPHRKKGTVHVQDSESFIAYIEKHQLAGTEVYADLARMKLVGVINAHDESDSQLVPGDAGWGDHRVELELLPTDAWKAWTSRDKKPMGQADFAEFIEDRAVDVINPDSATMLEIAQSLIATNGVQFKAAHRLTDGQVSFKYEETTNASAGHAGELEIPQTFEIGISPFEGAPPVLVTARFRYRISAGGLSLFFALLNADDIRRNAFTEYVAHVDEHIAAPVLKGRPE